MLYCNRNRTSIVNGPQQRDIACALRDTAGAMSISAARHRPPAYEKVTPWRPSLGAASSDGAPSLALVGSQRPAPPLLNPKARLQLPLIFLVSLLVHSAFFGFFGAEPEIRRASVRRRSRWRSSSERTRRRASPMCAVRLRRSDRPPRICAKKKPRRKNRSMKTRSANRKPRGRRLKSRSHSSRKRLSRRRKRRPSYRLGRPLQPPRRRPPASDAAEWQATPIIRA